MEPIGCPNNNPMPRRRPPSCPAASVARKLYMRQGMGVGLFRTVYGGRNKRLGYQPEMHCKASGGLVGWLVAGPTPPRVAARLQAHQLHWASGVSVTEGGVGWGGVQAGGWGPGQADPVQGIIRDHHQG